MSAWQKALVEAAARRQFPNMLFEEKWIGALAKAGMFPRHWCDNRGD